VNGYYIPTYTSLPLSHLGILDKYIPTPPKNKVLVGHYTVASVEEMIIENLAKIILGNIYIHEFT
jgi:hypothetical protein